MFSNEHDFKKIIDRLDIDTGPNPAHREKLRQQMLAVFNETHRSQRAASMRSAVRQAITRTVLQSKISKLAIAAVIIIATVVTIHQFVGPDVALANVIENMEKMPFIQIVNTEYHQATERVSYHWVNLGAKTMFAKYDEATWCWDCGEEKQYLYRNIDALFEVSQLSGDGFCRAESPTRLVSDFIGYAQSDQWQVHQRKGRFEGEPVEIFECSKSYTGENGGWMDGTLVAASKFELIVNRENELLVAGRKQWLDENGKVITYSKFAVSYPQDGPSDIYALGVPTTAKLLTAAHVAAKRDTEAKQTERMFGNRDVEGLLTMLTAGLVETRIAAANYLAQIGDASAIEPLQKLSEAWTTSDDNPFAAAVNTIKERLQLQDLQPPGAEPAEPNLSIIQAPGPEDTPFEFKPKGVLSGLITDAETNEPVVDARIEIRNHERYKTETDSNGFYHFDKVERDGGYTVTIHSTDYMWFGNWSDMSVVELRSDSQQIRHFPLKLGCQIDVEVVDEHNEPLEGINLYVTWVGQRYGREVDRRRRFKTEDDGTALLGAFEPSDVPYLITAIHDDYALTKSIVKLTDPNVVEYARIVMQEGVTVQGYAEYEDGVPVKDLAIQARPDWWNIGHNPGIVPIDSQGYFTFTHITPGLYTIYLRRTKHTLSPVTQIKLPPDDELLFVKIPRQSPQSGGPTVNGVDSPDDSSDTRVSISGTIASVGDTDIGQVRLNAYSRADGRGEGRIDGDRFAVDSLKPGLYTLIFSGDNIERKTLTNVRAPSDNLEVELRLIGKARVRGTVVHADANEPVSRFKLRVMKLKTFRHTGRARRRDWRSFSGPTGRFDLEVAGPGVYQVQVLADGLAPAWSSEMNTYKDEPVVVELNSGGSIEGRVVNEANEPIADAKVIPLSMACGPEPAAMHVFFTETGAVKTKAGQFIIRNVPRGLETIKVTHPDYCFTVVKDIEIQQGRTTDLNVVLSKGAFVEGHVYDHRGKPMAHELLYFQDASAYRFGDKLGRFASVVTDSNGFYRAEKLPERLCYVRRAKWGTMGLVCATVLPVKGKVTRLDFAGLERIVTGRILLDNQPLAETRMLLGDPFDPHAHAFIYYGATDARGHFTFSGVPTGWYGLYYKLPHDPGYAGEQWAKVATFFMTPEDTDLGAINIETTTANVTINFDKRNELFEGHELYLQEGRQFWGTRFGTVVKPESPSGPYTITGVPSGTYSLAVKRADNVIFMEPVTIDANETGAALTMNIAKCTASLTGMLETHPEVFVRLRRDDGRVIAVISGGGDGHYWIQGLPAGKYTIAGVYEGDSAPLATVTLTDDRTTYLDFDPWPLAQLVKAALHTQIVDSGGAPIDAASVWLESDGTIIEPCRITEQGQFFVCEPGRYTLRVSCPGYSPVEKPIDLRMKDLFGTGFSEGTMVITLRD